MFKMDSNTQKLILDDGDDVDARGLFGKQKPMPEGDSVILGLADSAEYSMNYPNRGKCLIFNHKNYEPHTGLNTRNGTDADAARLYCRFRDLQFDVTLHQDCKVKEVQKELSKVSKEDHSQNSAFVCIILSHGEQGILHAADGKYSTDSVFAPFRGDNCPSLLGKPKMFFIQACQGDQLDDGSKVQCKISTDSGSSREMIKIPNLADFLIVFSTVPGFYSWRNTSQGSWFIQALCKALQEHARDMDILSILTIVNRRVALDFESCTPQDSSMDLKKQVPYITSTLLRNIRFPVSEN